jgi:hypothetical protein
VGRRHGNIAGVNKTDWRRILFISGLALGCGILLGAMIVNFAVDIRLPLFVCALSFLIGYLFGLATLAAVFGTKSKEQK